MGAVDSIVKLATERATISIRQRLVRVMRLIISLRKLIDSFDELAISAATQKVQMKAIEDIFYQHPEIINNNKIDHFFSIKNHLDSEVLQYPLDSDRCRIIFNEILMSAVRTKKILQIKMIFFDVILLLILFCSLFFVFITVWPVVRKNLIQLFR